MHRYCSGRDPIIETMACPPPFPLISSHQSKGGQMDNLLKLLPLMDLPEAVRQPLLLDALAGRGNAMVGFVARRASDAAQDENRVDPQKVKEDAAAILAHLYRQAGTTDVEWAARLAALRAAIEASSDDDDAATFDDFASDSSAAGASFLVQLITGDDTIASAIHSDFAAALGDLKGTVTRLEQRHQASAAGKDRRRKPPAALARAKPVTRKGLGAGIFTSRKK